MRCPKCGGEHIQVCAVQTSDGVRTPWMGKVFCSFCGEAVVIYDEYFAAIEQAVEAAVARWEGENSGA